MAFPPIPKKSEVIIPIDIKILLYRNKKSKFYKIQYLFYFIFKFSFSYYNFKQSEKIDKRQPFLEAINQLLRLFGCLLTHLKNTLKNS